jgi:hypothetical protein
MTSKRIKLSSPKPMLWLRLMLRRLRHRLNRLVEVAVALERMWWM